MHPAGRECTPSPEAEQVSNFVGNWGNLAGSRIFRHFERVLKATTKKRSSTFRGRKVHPRQNPGYACQYAKEVKWCGNNNCL